MKPITKYIKENSNGYYKPISGRQIGTAFRIQGIEVRKMVNEARCAGEPICSCRSGYYYSENEKDIAKTIKSMQGRIDKQRDAISGLNTLLKP